MPHSLQKPRSAHSDELKVDMLSVPSNWTSRSHSAAKSDVNAYLHNLTGADFTAKDFRTWAASVMALAALRELEWQPESSAKHHVVSVVKDVARHLGNTPAVCRKCYIHPAVVDHFSAGKLSGLPRPRARKGLEKEEVALAAFL